MSFLPVRILAHSRFPSTTSFFTSSRSFLCCAFNFRHLSSMQKNKFPPTPAPVAPINIQYSPAVKGGALGTPAVKASPAAAAAAAPATAPRSPRAGFQPPKSTLKSKTAAAAAAAAVAVPQADINAAAGADAGLVAGAAVGSGAIVLSKARPTSVIAYGFRVDETQAVIEFMRQRNVLVVEHCDRPLNANWTRFRVRCLCQSPCAHVEV